MVNDLNSTTADTSPFTPHQIHSPKAPNSEPDVKQSNPSEAPLAPEKEWLQRIVEPLPGSKTENESEKDLQKTQNESPIRRQKYRC